MNAELAVHNTGSVLESVVIGGDLSGLSPSDRVMYYKQVCESLGLNPLTKPFEYMKLQGKMTLYARKDCTEQLRKLHHISIEIKARELVEECYLVTAKAVDKSGRCDEAIGAVSVQGLKGEARANAMMKAECVPLEYEILTKEGFKSPLDVCVGDMVAAMDPISHEIKWVPLLNRTIYENQEVIKYGNSAVEFEITKGHSWAVESNNDVRSLKPFEDIKSGTYLVLAGKEKETPDSLLTPQEAAILGWVITDGTIKKYKGKPYRASICQSKEHNFEHIEWALSIFDHVSKGMTDNCVNGWLDQHWWYLSNSQTQQIFSKACFRSIDDLPCIVGQLNYEAREAMLEAMMRADGDKRNNFGKSKPQIMETFQILCALNGHLTSKITVRNFERGTKPFFLQRKLSYNRVARQNLYEQESRFTTVWCPTTSLGTWICRAPTGQVMVTGNTKAKRRVTLSVAGLGMLDEHEVETIPGVMIGEPAAVVPEKTVSEESFKKLLGYMAAHNTPELTIVKWLEKTRVEKLRDLPEAFVQRLISLFAEKEERLMHAESESRHWDTDG